MEPWDGHEWAALAKVRAASSLWIEEKLKEADRLTEVDPILTMRTHTQSVLAVTMIASENLAGAAEGRAGAFATAGRDGSISIVSLPSPDHDKGEPYTYEEYQGLKTHSVKRAHDDAIWDIHAHPLTNVLFTAGADGIVRTWGLTSGMLDAELVQIREA